MCPSFLPASWRALGGAISLCVALLAVAGCGKADGTAAADPRQVGPVVKDEAVVLQSDGKLDPIASAEAVKGGSFFTWAGGYPKSLNMWLDYNSFSAQITQLMFESLIGMDTVTDDPVGVLAQTWEISADKKTYTFHLNPEAKWSDGKPVTAQDVQFYYDVMMNPKNLTSLFRVDLARFARPEVVDDRTVRIKAEEAHWKNFWAAGGFMALPKHVWEGKDFNEINFEFPVVSGPYRLYRNLTNRSITMQRRGDWWGRNLKINLHKYNFDYLVFRAEEDRTKALEMLKRGDFDLYPIYTSRIWVEQTPEIPQVKKNWIVRQIVYNQEPKSFQGFALNLRRPLFQDLRVREALARVLNRELMLDKIMFNQYFLLNNYYPDLYPDNRNPDAPLLSYNPDRARALLAEAGWSVDKADGVLKKDGKAFELVILYSGEPLPHYNIYLEDLKAVGIRARLEQVSAASFTKRVDDHDFDLVWSNWSASRLRDPETMWHSKTADDVATQNHPGLKDPEIDRLIEAQKTEMDGNKRNQILRQIDSRLVAAMPYVLLWQSDRNRLLYWNRFGTPPDVLDKFDREDSAIVYWWFDAKKSAALDSAQKTDQSLPAAAAEVHYKE
jgi:microcin C transport system substrate-binding protein